MSLRFLLFAFKLFFFLFLKKIKMYHPCYLTSYFVSSLSPLKWNKHNNGFEKWTKKITRSKELEMILTLTNYCDEMRWKRKENKWDKKIIFLFSLCVYKLTFSRDTYKNIKENRTHFFRNTYMNMQMSFFVLYTHFLSVISFAYWTYGALR